MSIHGNRCENTCHRVNITDVIMLQGTHVHTYKKTLLDNPFSWYVPLYKYPTIHTLEANHNKHESSKNVERQSTGCNPLKACFQLTVYGGYNASSCQDQWWMGCFWSESRHFWCNCFTGLYRVKSVPHPTTTIIKSMESRMSRDAARFCFHVLFCFVLTEKWREISVIFYSSLLELEFQAVW